MTQREATQLFNKIRAELVEKTGLDLLSKYTLFFDNGKRRIGGHWGWRRQISLSRHFIVTMAAENIEDTIRHEFAHACDFLTRGKSDHSVHWKRWAVKCGAKPNRVKNLPEAQLVAHKYERVCPNCKQVCGKYHRKPRARHACSDCCAKYNRGRFDERFLLQTRKVA